MGNWWDSDDDDDAIDRMREQHKRESGQKGKKVNPKGGICGLLVLAGSGIAVGIGAVAVTAVRHLA